jgi:hypothetical protein
LALGKQDLPVAALSLAPGGQDSLRGLRQRRTALLAALADQTQAHLFRGQDRLCVSAIISAGRKPVCTATSMKA